MTALYIIGAVAAYLLIGSVVAGLLIRSDKSMSDDCWIGIIGWPCILILIVPVVVFLAVVKLAKRIGGVK